MARKRITDGWIWKLSCVATAIIVCDSLSVFFWGGHVLTACVILWLFLSVKALSANQLAVIIRMSQVVGDSNDDFISDGLFFIPFGIERLYIVSTRQMKIDVPRQEGLATLEKSVGGKEYSSIHTNVDMVVYFLLPDDFGGILQAFLHGPDFTNQKEIEEFFVPYVASNIRRACGESAYIEIQTSDPSFTTAFKNGVLNDPQNPFSQCGIDKFWLGTQGMTLPEGLSKALSAKQIALLNQAGALIDAETKSATTATEGKGIAAALRDRFNAMKENPEMAGLYTFKEAAQGPSNFFTDVHSFLSAYRLGGKEKNILIEALSGLPDEQISKFSLLTPESQANILQGLIKFYQESLNKH